jgi:hypothetical protein
LHTIQINYKIVVIDMGRIIDGPHHRWAASSKRAR